MKFTEEELNIIEASLRGTLSRLGADKHIEKLIEKITERGKHNECN